MAEKNKKPEIRFKGFTEDWEKQKVFDCAPLQRGFDLPISEMKVGNYPVVMSNGISHYHSDFKVKGPGVVTGRSGTIGNVHYIDSNYWPHNTALWVTNFKENNPRYIYYMYNKLDLNRLGTGSGVPTLNRNDVHDKYIFIPNREEQSKICTLLTHLDHLIALHQQKYNKLIIVKKAMLEKMFPKNGANVPDIRFKGFTEAWEIKKLGEVTDSYSGGTPSVGNEEYYGGEIPFIRSAEINSNSTELFITEKGLNNSSAKIVNIGYILYALYGATSGEVGRARIKGAINQAILAIIPKNDYDEEFIKQWLRKKKQEIISTYLQGGQGNLSGTIVKDLSIDLPCYDEQCKIGSYFTHLDNLITLQKREVEKLKNIKKAYLEKMFV